MGSSFVETAVECYSGGLDICGEVHRSTIKKGRSDGG